MTQFSLRLFSFWAHSVQPHGDWFNLFMPLSTTIAMWLDLYFGTTLEHWSACYSRSCSTDNFAMKLDIEL